MAHAEQWAQQHPRPDGYCIARELVAVDEFEGWHPRQASQMFPSSAPHHVDSSISAVPY
jgi:hypothetical protein